MTRVQRYNKAMYRGSDSAKERGGGGAFSSFDIGIALCVNSAEWM